MTVLCGGECPPLGCHLPNCRVVTVSPEPTRDEPERCNVWSGERPNRIRCAEDATLVVYDANCAVCDSRGYTCNGHEVCEFHGADLRAKQYPAFAQRPDSPVFKPSRIHTLAAR